jgi:hypothetical protein
MKKENNDLYNPFNIKSYRTMLFYGFKIGVEFMNQQMMSYVSKKIIENLTQQQKTPSVLRGFLPIRIKEELDVKREFYT